MSWCMKLVLTGAESRAESRAHEMKILVLDNINALTYKLN